jgi:hypothetical protein
VPTIFRDKVVAGTVTFNDRLNMPAGCVEFGLDTLDGWRKSSDLDVRSTPYGGAVDGESSNGYWSANARHLIASGYVVALDRMTAEEVEDIILGDAFPTNEDIVLVRYEGIPRFMRVKVTGEAEVINVGPNNFRWIVPLQTVGSPFKFSYEPLQGEIGTSGAAGISTGGRTYPRTYPLTYVSTDDGSGNSVALYNHGTAPADPFVEIYGPLPKGGWRLENATTGEFIQFDVDLSSTDLLTIDFSERVARRNGYPVTALITGDFWKARRGVNVVKLYAPYDEATSFTISINSAWR